MKTFLCMAVMVMFAMVAKADTYGKEQLEAEKAFMLDQDSPKLYSMQDAIALHKVTGKPVLCWMGEHAFADFNVRKLSMELKDSTIQASMATDGTPNDRFNPRVKFDTEQYVSNGKTYFIRASSFKFENDGSFGPTVRAEETTGYKLTKMFETKKFPDGKLPK